MVSEYDGLGGERRIGLEFLGLIDDGKGPEGEYLGGFVGPKFRCGAAHWV